MDISMPDGLGDDGQWFWKRATGERDYTEAHDLERLRIAAKCLDDIRVDQAVLDRDGRYVRARFNRLVAHPAIKTIQENRALFLRTVNSMGLDITDDRGQQTRLF
jgi:hypothetical protein